MNSKYIQMMNDVLQQVTVKYSNLKPDRRWEYFKEDIRTNSIKFSKGEASDRRIAISQLSEIVTEYENDLDTLTENELELLENSKHELENLQQEYIHGVIFRTRTRWMEEGEKNSKYFFSLEKSKYNAKTCTVLMKKDGSLTTNEEEIFFFFFFFFFLHLNIFYFPKI